MNCTDSIAHGVQVASSVLSQTGRRFRSLYGEAKQEMQVAVRASKHGSSKCTCCTLIESQLARATSMVDKGLVQAIKLEHLAFHAAEAKHYENHSIMELINHSMMYPK